MPKHMALLGEVPNYAGTFETENSAKGRNETDASKKSHVDDDAMVVFPTASGKLATTWMKNVDNIISEGTGDISVERLKVMQGKLKTALDLVTNRIIDIRGQAFYRTHHSARPRMLLYD